MTMEGIGEVLSVFNDLPKGLQEGIVGAVLGLFVQAILMWADWGENDLLMFGLGIFILILMGISTFTEVMGKSRGFQIGFIIGSLLHNDPPLFGECFSHCNTAEPKSQYIPPYFTVLFICCTQLC